MPAINIYGIGLPRTGTNSLAVALNEMGIGGENFCSLNKFKNSYSSQRAKLKFFIRNDAYADIRSFVSDKIEDEPRTLFVLTHRDGDEWNKSIQSWRQSKKDLSQFETLCEQNSEQYLNHVITLFQQLKCEDNLLILNFFTQSDKELWQKLGGFLNMTVNPNKVFPNVNLNHDSRMDQFLSRLKTGGDSRIVINPKTKRNKYLSEPSPSKELLCRSSTTCNHPSEEGFEYSYKVFESLIDDNGVVNNARFLRAQEDIRNKIYTLCGMKSGNVLLTPSGTDAEYIPIIVSKNISPNKKIVNIVTRVGEIGSSSHVAAELKYFDNVTPFGSDGSKKGKSLDDSWDIEVIGIDARNERGELGEDMADCIMKTLDEHPLYDEDANIQQQKASFIVHSVAQSKTGTIDEPLFVESAVNVIDCCQMRCDIKQVGKWVNQGFIVLISGSKFYGSPPFCGAVLLPKWAVGVLENAEERVLCPSGLGEVLTQFEIPNDLSNIQNTLSQKLNVGLLCRWNIAIFEMIRYNASQSDKQQAIAQWNQRTKRLIEKSDHLSVLESENSNQEKTIIPFTVRLSNGSLANVTQLKKIHHDLLFNCNCYVGQPVKITEELGVLRMALSSKNVLDLISHYDQESDKDIRIINQIESLITGKHNTRFQFEA